MMSVDRFSARPRRGLSLVEVLLAVFILGIGVISVAALFPAGITQQRQSNDAAIGGLVADNAIALLRTRLNPNDFGEGSLLPPFSGPGGLAGDFGWARPGFVTNPNGTTIDGIFLPQGSIIVFNPTPGASGTVASEVPWNGLVHGNDPPRVVFTQRDRYYPMAPTYTIGQIDPQRPQYAWDVMFRRFQGRMQAAIFVYRVTRPIGESGLYAVQPNPSQAVPPLPIRVDLSQAPFAIWNSSTDIVPNTNPGSQFELANDRFAWQFPGQWLLDQKGTVHRVAAGRRRASDGPVRLSARPPLLNATFAHTPTPNVSVPSEVRDIWFIPIKDTSATSSQPLNTLTTVYVTVREL